MCIAVRNVGMERRQGRGRMDRIISIGPFYSRGIGVKGRGWGIVYVALLILTAMRRIERIERRKKKKNNNNNKKKMKTFF